MTEWFETCDEGLWLPRDEKGAEEAVFLQQVLALHSGDRVLDAPCGAGRVAVHLAKIGCRMAGVDRNPNFIARAQQRFAGEGLVGEFTVQDLRQLAYRDAFAGIYNWGGSFGYFSDAQNYDLLCRYAAALHPGGRLCIDQINRERVLRHFQTSFQQGYRMVSARWDAAGQRIDSVYTWEGQAQPCGHSSIRVYTPAQFQRLLAQAGLELLATYGDAAGTPFNSRASARYITVAQKPA